MTLASWKAPMLAVYLATLIAVSRGSQLTGRSLLAGAPSTAPKKAADAPAPVAAAGMPMGPAPGPPSAGRMPVDGVLVLPAKTATLANATTLMLSGLPNTTTWVKTSSPRAGAISLDYLVSENMADKNGSFASTPQASLTGMVNGNITTILMQLDEPRLDAPEDTLEFTIKLLAANEAALPDLNGTVNAYAASSPSSAAPPIAPGTTFSNATLIIDIADIETYVDPSIGEKLTVVRVARRPVARAVAYATTGCYYPYYGYWCG